MKAKIKEKLTSHYRKNRTVLIITFFLSTAVVGALSVLSIRSGQMDAGTVYAFWAVLFFLCGVICTVKHAS